MIWSNNKINETFRKLTSIGPRFAGTTSEKDASEYIYNKLSQVNLDKVERNSFAFTGWTEGYSKLAINSKIFETLPLPNSPAGEVNSKLIYLEEGVTENYICRDVKGKIVMVNSGMPSDYPSWMHRIEKYNLAVEKGAIAFIYANHYPGNLPITGAVKFDEIGAIPGVGISYETMYSLKRYAENKNVFLKVDTNIKELESQNIIGYISSKKNKNRFNNSILIGAHYDSHDISPGAIDNAAAVSILIELAYIIKKIDLKLNYSVVFAFFGGEEVGLLGSKNFINRDKINLKENIKLMINVDGIGETSSFQFNTQGFDFLKNYLKEISREFELNIDFTNYLWPYSDHLYFVRNNIPSFQVRPKSSDRGRGWGHTSADTPDKVDNLNLKSNATILAQIILYICMHGFNKSLGKSGQQLKGTDSGGQKRQS